MDGKVIAVTGGASGIGLALAKLLATRGAKVSICDVSRANLDKAAAAIKEASTGSSNVLTTQCDVRDLSQVKSWLKQTVDRFGRLDGAANVAGVIGKNHGLDSGMLERQDENEWDFVIGVNLTGAMHCMKEELQLLQSGGSIVNASSIAGLKGFTGNAAYSASKAALIALTRVAAREAGDRNIRVNAVTPGLIDTPMLSLLERGATKDESLDATVARVPLPRKADPMEVAKVMAFLLSDESSFVTGSVYAVDGGWEST